MKWNLGYWWLNNSSVAHSYYFCMCSFRMKGVGWLDFCTHGAMSIALSLGFPFTGEARVGLSCLEMYLGTCIFRPVFFCQISHMVLKHRCVTFNWTHLEGSADFQFSLLRGEIHFYFNVQGFRHVKLTGEIYLNLCPWKWAYNVFPQGSLS